MIMKQLPQGNKIFSKTFFCSLLFVFGFSLTTFAQLSLSWRAAGATGTDDYFKALNGPPETINCDMYTDMSANNIGSSVVAVVWDEWDGSQYVCSLGVYDASSGTRFDVLIATDARHPDVVLLDPPTANPGELYACVVYEDVTGNTIEYTESNLEFFMGATGGSITVGAFSTSTTISNTSYNAVTPHIDGLMEDYYATNSNMYYWSGTSSSTYEPYTKWAATWTENQSGTNKIYTTIATSNAGTIPSGTYVVDGEWSDLGAVFVLDATVYDMAYISYVDAGVLKVIDFDYSTSTAGTALTLENSVTIVAPPRIDALNVQDPASSNLNWMAVAQVDNGGVNQVRSYEPGSPVTTNDYATQQPLSITSPITEGHLPAVATGPGPDTKTPGVGSEYGNEQYINTFRITPGAMQALDRNLDNNSATATWNGYNDINKDPLDNSSTYGNVLISAVGTSSNSGVGHVTAWHDFEWDGGYPKDNSQIVMYKFTTAAMMSFKPTAVNNVANNKNLTTYPNPANYTVTVNGLKEDATYAIMDMSGKVLKTGNITTNNKDIDVSNMPSGVYIFNITEGDNFNRLKFTKY